MATLKDIASRAGSAWLLVALGAAAPAAAQDAARIEIANQTARPLECQVLAAHWYAPPARTVPAGGRLTLRLSRGAGAAAPLFALAGGLPVERIYCGPAGQAWAGRSELDLPDLSRRASQGGALPVACRGDGAMLRCR